MAVDILLDFPSKKCTTCEERVLTVKEKFIIDSDTDEFKRVTAVGCKKAGNANKRRSGRMATLKCSCKDCEKRHHGCHGHCEDYKEFRERCEEVKRNRTGSILADPLISTMVRKRAWRRIHRKGEKIMDDELIYLIFAIFVAMAVCVAVLFIIFR